MLNLFLIVFIQTDSGDQNVLTLYEEDQKVYSFRTPYTTWVIVRDTEQSDMGLGRVVSVAPSIYISTNVAATTVGDTEETTAAAV